MREILFRGKREDNGELVQGHYHNTTYVGYPNGGDNKITRHYILPKNAGDAHVVIAETVGQFTGLTDKNGKKIFEGDIVKCRHRLVKFYLDDIEKANPRRSYGKEIVETDSYGFSCFYWRNYAVSFYDGCIRVQNGSDHHEIRTNYINNHKIEVIGNIHDNPELLGVAADG